jgi:hypothetical protein
MLLLGERPTFPDLVGLVLIVAAASTVVYQADVRIEASRCTFPRYYRA